MSNDNPRKGESFECPAVKGRWPLTAGKRYSSGTWHGSWDIGCPIGTPVYAPVSGVVTDCNDGVRNQPVGTPSGPGRPSNWVLLSFTAKDGKPYTYWFQHLNKGLRVKKGQRVVAGQHIANSGNSGNTYGPHLHLTLIKGRRTGTGRWAYENDHSQAVYPPSWGWLNAKETDMPLTDADVKKVAKAVWEYQMSTGWQNDGTYDKKKPTKKKARDYVIEAWTMTARGLRRK